ncbi:MAG: hypothetical protein ABWY93_07980 [Mycobacterium sp.]
MAEQLDVHVQMTMLWIAADRPTFKSLGLATDMGTGTAHAAVRGPHLVELSKFKRVLHYLAEQTGKDPEPVLGAYLDAASARYAGLSTSPRARPAGYLFLVLNSEGLVLEMLTERPRRAFQVAANAKGLVVRLPIIADFTERTDRPAGS